MLQQFAENLFKTPRTEPYRDRKRIIEDVTKTFRLTCCRTRSISHWSSTRSPRDSPCICIS